MKRSRASSIFTLVLALLLALPLGLTSLSTRAAPQTELDLYSDSLASGWQNWSWDTTADFSNTAPVHDGSASLAVTHTAWAGLYLRNTGTPLAPGDYEVLRFWANGGSAGGQQINIKLAGSDNSMSTGSTLPRLTANTWTRFEIPLASLGSSPDIAGLVFQEVTGGAQPLYYLDSLQFGFLTQPTAGPSPTPSPLPPTPSPSAELTIAIDPSADRHPISPLIYGVNQDLGGVDRLPARRLGGNRTTGYNWENNASNAGSDYLHSSDSFLCSNSGISTSLCDSTPGVVYTTFHDQSLAQGAYSLLTLQMAGYVSRDKNGAVSAAETAPSARWDRVQFAKGAPFRSTPVLTDGVVYMDEFVNFLVQKYGPASSPSGVRGYSLDNEPSLWPSTHPRIHPSKPTYAEMITRTVQLASAVKSVDPQAEIYGPASYGFGEYLNLQDAPDKATEGAGYRWFIDYYLDKLHRAEQSSGKRLLDVLDLHWYPEARGGGKRITFEGTGDIDTQKARLQAPRSLWDPSYTEDSWIAQYFPSYLPLLPQLQSSIATYYPGTKLAITEFNYGGEDHITGGLATADVLGIFGRYNLYMATHWGSDPTYLAAAYKLYRNYDGKHGSYGDTHIRATTSDNVNSSVYASQNADGTELHIIVLNKSFEQSLTGQFSIAGAQAYSSGQVWGFDQYRANLFQAEAVSALSGNRFAYVIPPLTAYHIVLRAASTPTVTPTTTPDPSQPTTTATPSVTPTSVPSAIRPRVYLPIVGAPAR